MTQWTVTHDSCQRPNLQGLLVERDRETAARITRSIGRNTEEEETSPNKKRLRNTAPWAEPHWSEQTFHRWMQGRKEECGRIHGKGHLWATSWKAHGSHRKVCSERAGWKSQGWAALGRTWTVMLRSLSSLLLRQWSPRLLSTPPGRRVLTTAVVTVTSSHIDLAQSGARLLAEDAAKGTFLSPVAYLGVPNTSCVQRKNICL